MKGSEAKTYLPIFRFVNTIRISFGEFRPKIESRDGRTELRHGMKLGRKIIQHGDDVLRNIGTIIPFARHPLDLESENERVESTGRIDALLVVGWALEK